MVDVIGTAAAKQPPRGGAAATRKSEANRQSILEAGRQAFTRKGFAGTSIADITKLSNVSRANFYYYFRDKRDLFLELGTATYHEAVRVATSFGELPARPLVTDLQAWVQDYFVYLDGNGAFLLRSNDDRPDDTEFNELVRRLETRNVATLGHEVSRRAVSPFGDSRSVGVAITAMLERTWYQCQHGTADRDDTITTIAQMLSSMLR